MSAGGRHHHTHNGAAGSDRPGIHTTEHLAEHLAELLQKGACLIGVGNDLCGDDGAGPAVARSLAGKVPWTVFDTQSCPESYLMKIVELAPPAIILIDALEMSAEPGTVDLVEAENITGQGPSTHGPAPLAFLDLLKMMHPCRQAVLGIQPARGEVGDEMSEPVLRAVKMVTSAFLAVAERAGSSRDPA